VVSRSAVSSSADAQPTKSSAAALRTYYCLCGEFILVIDKPLNSLPRRNTDNSVVIRTQDTEAGPARAYKLNTVLSEPFLLERSDGHERQYRHKCPRCTLPVGYQTMPPPCPYVYILSGALSQTQGQIPSDAFDGEHPLPSEDKPAEGSG
ncbi:hypothetical protein FISHEDRAFT_41025, partial [Fistulina hepatica ATCC 64428]